MYGSYIDDPIKTEFQGETYYYVKDRQYSITGILDNSGEIVETYRYSSFGLMTIFDKNGNKTPSSAIANPYGYTGRRWDAESSLWYYRNRMYSATIGRFLQRDPAGYVDGMCLYAYVMNNPLKYLDAWGLAATTSQSGYTEWGHWNNEEDQKSFIYFAGNNNDTMSDAGQFGVNKKNDTMAEATDASVVGKVQRQINTAPSSIDGTDLPSIAVAGITAATAAQVDSPMIGPADAVALFGFFAYAIYYYWNTGDISPKYEEHTGGTRPSTWDKHSKKRPGAPEKGDKNRRPPRKKPPNYRGPWPPPVKTK